MTTTQSGTTTATLPAPGTYTVDPMHSSVGFVARHLMAAKVRGSFKEFDGTIVIGETPEQSSVTATVTAASVTTNQDQRDEHLRSADFFETDAHPQFVLTSKAVTPKGDGTYTLVTDLTIKGITKEVAFDLEFLGQSPGLAPNTKVAGFEATTTIDRREFGVSFDRAIENGSFVLGNKIELEISVEASAPA